MVVDLELDVHGRGGVLRFEYAAEPRDEIKELRRELSWLAPPYRRWRFRRDDHSPRLRRAPPWVWLITPAARSAIVAGPDADLADDRDRSQRLDRRVLVGRALFGDSGYIVSFLSFGVAMALVAAYRRFVQKRPVFGAGAYAFPERGVGVEQQRERLQKLGIDPNALSPDPRKLERSRLEAALQELHRAGLLDDEELAAKRAALDERSTKLGDACVSAWLGAACRIIDEIGCIIVGLIVGALGRLFHPRLRNADLADHRRRHRGVTSGRPAHRRHPRLRSRRCDRGPAPVALVAGTTRALARRRPGPTDSDVRAGNVRTAVSPQVVLPPDVGLRGQRAFVGAVDHASARLASPLRARLAEPRRDRNDHTAYVAGDHLELVSLRDGARRCARR